MKQYLIDENELSIAIEALVIAANQTDNEHPVTAEFQRVKFQKMLFIFTELLEHVCEDDNT